MTSTIKTALYTLLLGWLLTVPVHAQEPRTSAREIATLAGIVDRVDRTSRALTLRVANGVKESVYVAPDVKVFDELKIGDNVTVRVVESVIVALRPDLKPTVPVDTTAAAKKESGSAGQGDVLQQLKAVVTIEIVDLRAQTVTYNSGNNLRVIRAVADPGLIQGLKPGDVIEITYTRARAIEVQRKR